MARYEHITSFIDRIEALSSEAECQKLHQEFLDACYDPFVLDLDCSNTLERYGLLTCDRYLHANVESLDIEAAIAALTLIHRMAQGECDPRAKTPLMIAFESGYAARLLRRIAELDGTYQRPAVVTFYHEYEKDGYLSNWFNSPFSYGGETFATSEHWMMWQKARVFGDWDIASQILPIPATDQAKVKWLGKQVKGYSDEVWDAVNLQLMRVGLRQKFLQNEPLLNGLLSTGSAVLGEAAGTKDAKWGVGFDKHSAKLADPANWYGDSLLGRTLMEVRSDLRRLCSCSDNDWPEWPIENLQRSHVWQMSLLELSRIPSTRSIALMYATVAARFVSHFQSAHDVLRQVRATIGEIDESMRLNMGCGLPFVGWHELLDELALQVKLGRIC